MIDLHCHILPAIDDGPTSLAQSVEMAEIAVHNSIHTILATPHTLNNQYTNSYADIRRLTTTLQQALDVQKIPLTLYPGAEVHFCAGLSGLIRDAVAPTINGNGRYILLELPFHSVPAELTEEIFQLRLQGVTPVLAHPERNLDFIRCLDPLYDLVAQGVLCQLTSFSITGEFGRDVQRCAEQMLKDRLAHVIASDAHLPDDRFPTLSEAVERAAEILANYQEARCMVTETPEAILNGAAFDLSQRAAKKPVKKRWFFF